MNSLENIKNSTRKAMTLLIPLFLASVIFSVYAIESGMISTIIATSQYSFIALLALTFIFGILFFTTLIAESMEHA